MKTSKRLQCLAGLVLCLGLLAACGDGNGIHFTIERSNWPLPWPHPAKVFVDTNRTEHLPVTNQLRLQLTGANGNIELTGQPATDAVTVTAHLRVGADSFSEAQAGLEQLDFAVTTDADEILVRTLQPPLTQGHQYIVDYTISLPAHLAVEVSHGNGHVRVAGIAGTVSVELGNGNLVLAAITGNAVASIDNGDIDASLEVPPAGALWLSTFNGDIALQLPRSTSAFLSASAENGDIGWIGLDLADVQQTGGSLSATLGAGEGTIHLETTNGAIRLTGFAE